MALGAWWQPASAADEPFIFGMMLVGPYNDRGWSQAHFEAGKYVEEKTPGKQIWYLPQLLQGMEGASSAK